MVAKMPANMMSGKVNRVADSSRNNVPIKKVVTTFNAVDVSKDVSMPIVNMMPIKTAATSIPTIHDFSNNRITRLNLDGVAMGVFILAAATTTSRTLHHWGAFGQDQHPFAAFIRTHA
tara:strand:+ start:12 stop:365 length:354 start_codon:yes stop_codon:yes gene_type:complete